MNQLPAAEHTPNTDQFRVGLGSHLLGGLFTSFPKMWSRISKLESMVLQEQLNDIQIERPVYITGLARGGTTILLEILSKHPQVATHQYRDYPGLFTPYWWGQAQAKQTTELTERAHGDGLMVNQQSPEAMEEVLWQAFFPNAHDPRQSQILDQSTNCSSFEDVYQQHIRKLMLLRGRSRYVVKGNYNLSRLGYIQKLLDDAMFIVAIRNPLNHVASMIKQHRLFSAAGKNHPRSLAHLRRVGHYEFGLDRRPINVGNRPTIESIEQLWNKGQEVRGWARYWASLYGWLHEYLKSNPQLASRVCLVRYEDLCCDAAATLKPCLEQCGLWDPVALADVLSTVRSPRYYDVDFDAEQIQGIHQETAEVAAKFGYAAAN